MSDLGIVGHLAKMLRYYHSSAELVISNLISPIIPLNIGLVTISVTYRMVKPTFLWTRANPSSNIAKFSRHKTGEFYWTSSLSKAEKNLKEM
jgi:hypothetical protein